MISMDLADTVNSDLDKITTISPVALEALSPHYHGEMNMAEAMPIVEDVDSTIHGALSDTLTSGKRSTKA